MGAGCTRVGPSKALMKISGSTKPSGTWPKSSAPKESDWLQAPGSATRVRRFHTTMNPIFQLQRDITRYEADAIYYQDRAEHCRREAALSRQELEEEQTGTRAAQGCARARHDDSWP